MILSVHLLTGAAIATRVQNPILGLLLAFLSHFVLDFIPHREYATFPGDPIKERWKGKLTTILKIAVDFLIGVSILLILSKNKILALSGGFLAISPDFDSIAFIFPDLLKIPPFRMFFYFHLGPLHFLRNKKIPFFWEIFSQAAIFFIAISLLR